MGYFIKPTVLIVLIAIIAEMILKCEWKNTLLLVGCFALVFICSKHIFHKIFYPTYLDEQKAYELNTPVETWIYMGLNDDFGFSGDDTKYSRSFSDPIERKNGMRKAVKARIEERGIWGTINHEFEKLVTAYSDGTFELSYTFQFGLQEETSMTEFLTLTGSKYGSYWMLCAFVYYQILLFAAVLPIINLLNIRMWKNDYMMYSFVPMITLFGLQLFLMIWEAHYRYTVNHYPILLIVAVYGIYGLGQKREKSCG